MATRNTKQRRRLEKVATLIGSTDLSSTVETVKARLAIDNRLRMPYVAHVEQTKTAVKTARATKRGAKRPFVINK